MHAQKLADKARDAAERRSYDLAIELYLQALTLDPDHLDARRGLRAAELKKFDAYYPSSITRFFGSLGYRFSGWIARIGKNHEKRMIACEKILASDPKNKAVGATLAEAAIAAGHRDAAIAAYEGILSVHADDIDAVKGLGRLLYQKGEPHEALEVFERALRIDSKDQEAVRMRKNLAAEVSITAAGLDRADHSRDILRDREKTAKLEQETRNIRGVEDIKDSATGIEDRLAEDPDNPKLLAELGARYGALKEYDKAIEAYQKAFGLEPTNYTLREKAGDLRIAALERKILKAKEDGDAEEIERISKERLAFQAKEFGERVKDHPTDLSLHFQLGRALHDSGDLDGAIAEFQQTVRDPRRKIESLTMLGNCFIEKGMFDLAENQLRKALAETPGMSGRTKDILYSLGLLKERQGRPEEALTEFKKIYEVDISFKDVISRMEDLKRQSGD